MKKMIFHFILYIFLVELIDHLNSAEPFCDCKSPDLKNYIFPKSNQTYRLSDAPLVIENDLGWVVNFFLKACPKNRTCSKTVDFIFQSICTGMFLNEKTILTAGRVSEMLILINRYFDYF